MSRAVQEGQLVFSRSGRDKGQAYMVRSLQDESFVSLVNGEKRGLTNPKRKNIRHLYLTSSCVEDIGKRLKEGRPVSDAEIRFALGQLTAILQENPEREAGGEGDDKTGRDRSRREGY